MTKETLLDAVLAFAADLVQAGRSGDGRTTQDASAPEKTSDACGGDVAMAVIAAGSKYPARGVSVGARRAAFHRETATRSMAQTH